MEHHKKTTLYWIASLGCITLLAYYGSVFLSFIATGIIIWRKPTL